MPVCGLPRLARSGQLTTEEEEGGRGSLPRERKKEETNEEKGLFITEVERRSCCTRYKWDEEAKVSPPSGRRRSRHNSEGKREENCLGRRKKEGGKEGRLSRQEGERERAKGSFHGSLWQWGEEEGGGGRGIPSEGDPRRRRRRKKTLGKAVALSFALLFPLSPSSYLLSVCE